MYPRSTYTLAVWCATLDAANERAERWRLRYNDRVNRVEKLEAKLLELGVDPATIT